MILEVEDMVQRERRLDPGMCSMRHLEELAQSEVETPMLSSVDYVAEETSA